MTTFADIKYESARVTFPSLGVWQADIHFVGLNAPAVGTEGVLVLGEQEFVGTVINLQIVSAAMVKLKIVGGKGNFDKLIEAKHFKDKTVSEIITSMLGNLETVSSFPSKIESTILKHAQLFNNIPIGHQLTNLSITQGFNWYLNNDGQVAFEERDNNRVIQLPENSKILDKDYAGNIKLQVLDLVNFPLPGGTYNNKTIEEVRVCAEKVETIVYLNRTNNKTNLKEIINSNFKHQINKLYECKIIGQNSDGPGGVVGGTLNIEPVDPTIRGGGLSKVPIVVPQGLLLQVMSDNICYMRYSDEGRWEPKVVGFQNLNSDDASNLIWIVGSNSGAQFVALSNIVNANFEALETWLAGHVHNTGVGISSNPVVAPPVPDDVASSVLKTN